MLSIQKITILISRISQLLIFRYIVNGLVATALHYTILTINIEVYSMKSAGVANIIAVFFGILASFIGSRYFVFKSHKKPLSIQSIQFLSLYALIAVIHGTLLYLWTDLNGFDYRIGFVVASIVQFLISFFGNKLLVFKL